ncbi:NAD(P)/FAD-dependent oxidoreductase [Stakelama marina]|uniref:FAD-dependent oxidoreductase n=1 Tax=Stakelama marina TaxID=2826939 RepID=A0A8T4ICT1_9SPHN|nr:FAD-dependent oxidoreductase [Stakelama marina]MBR0551654.1 FAD-dependent oxidoreductase [Stakelama marina]
MRHFDVLIVGGGHGGAQAAIALRQAGFEGSLAIVTEENELPYERPPLSKDYLAGQKPFERMLIRPAAFWEERSVTFLTGTRIEAVDADAHELTSAAGERIGYGKLIWAAGGDARRLSCAGGDLVGVHTVRTRADVDRMITELPSVERAVVVGGGYIGLEAASALVKQGKQVVLIEALDRVLARVAGEPLSRFYEHEHRSHGVDLRLGAVVDHVVGEDGSVTGVQMADGELLACDMVIVGIGIEPAVAPLIRAGAKGDNGVAVDAQCRTSLPDIFAVGDCALHRNRCAGGGEVRIESVQNATDQANVAARTIMGQDVSYDAVPWFWSDQYDLKLQTVGLSNGYDDIVMRGDPAARKFSLIYLREGRVIALDCINNTRDYAQGRKLVMLGASPDRGDLANDQVPLKELAS